MGHYVANGLIGVLNWLNQMDRNKQLVDAILASADKVRENNGKKKLTCAAAFKLALEYEAQIAEIGRICNQYNVKICKCQLGCFK